MEVTQRICGRCERPESEAGDLSPDPDTDELWCDRCCEAAFESIYAGASGPGLAEREAHRHQEAWEAEREADARADAAEYHRECIWGDK